MVHSVESVGQAVGYAYSWTVATRACASMPFTTAEMPPASATRRLLLLCLQHNAHLTGNSTRCLPPRGARSVRHAACSAMHCNARLVGPNDEVMGFGSAHARGERVERCASVLLDRRVGWVRHHRRDDRRDASRIAHPQLRIPIAHSPPKRIARCKCTTAQHSLFILRWYRYRSLTCDEGCAANASMATHALLCSSACAANDTRNGCGCGPTASVPRSAEYGESSWRKLGPKTAADVRPGV